MSKENENVPGEGASLVFLIGAFRSGTSLLHRLINRRPDVALMWKDGC